MNGNTPPPPVEENPESAYQSAVDVGRVSDITPPESPEAYREAFQPTPEGQPPELLKAPPQFDPSRAVPAGEEPTAIPPLLQRPAGKVFNPANAIPAEEAQVSIARDEINQYLAGQKEMTFEQWKAANDIAEGKTYATQRLVSGTGDVISGLWNSAVGIAKDPHKAAAGMGKWLSTRGEEFYKPWSDAAEKVASGDYEGAAKAWTVGQLAANKNLGVGIVAGTAGMVSSGIGLVQGAANVAGDTTGINAIKSLTGLSNYEKFLSSYVQHKINKTTNELFATTKTDPENVFTQVGELIPWIAAGEASGVSAATGLAGRLGEAAPAALQRAAAVGTKVAEPIVRRAAPVVGGIATAAAGHPLIGAAEVIMGAFPRGVLHGWPARLVHGISDWPANQIAKLNEAFSTVGKPGQVMMEALTDKTRMEAGKVAGVTDNLRAAQDVEKVNQWLNPDNTLKVNPSDLSKKAAESLKKSIPTDIQNIADLAEQARNLNSKADFMQKLVKANKLLTSTIRGTVATGVQLGEAAAIGGALGGAQAAPGATEQIQEGANALVLMAAPFAPLAARSGLKQARFDFAHRELKNYGLENLAGDVSKLPQHIQDNLYTFAGFNAKLGKQLFVDTADQIKRARNIPEDQEAVNGYVDESGNIHINEEAVGEGVAPHETQHVIQELFGQQLGKLHPDEMKEFKDLYMRGLSRSGEGAGGFKPDFEKERDAEIGRHVMEQTPIEMFYGGERGGDILKRWISGVLKGEEGPIQTTGAFKAPFTRGDVRSVKERLFKAGEKAAYEPSKIPDTEMEARVQSYVDHGMTEDAAIQKVAQEAEPQLWKQETPPLRGAEAQLMPATGKEDYRGYLMRVPLRPHTVMGDPSSKVYVSNTKPYDYRQTPYKQTHQYFSPAEGGKQENLTFLDPKILIREAGGFPNLDELVSEAKAQGHDGLIIMNKQSLLPPDVDKVGLASHPKEISDVFNHPDDQAIIDWMKANPSKVDWEHPRNVYIPLEGPQSAPMKLKFEEAPVKKPTINEVWSKWLNGKELTPEELDVWNNEGFGTGWHPQAGEEGRPPSRGEEGDWWKKEGGEPPQFQAMPATFNVPFHSKAVRALEANPQNKWTADQLRGFLKGKGVSPSEMEWSGINDLKGDLSKRQAIEAIQHGMPQLVEQKLGGMGEEYTRIQQQESQLLDMLDNATTPNERQAIQDQLDGINEKYQQARVQIDPARYETPDLVLGGGTNYRELLMTLENPRAEKGFTVERDPDTPDGYRIMDQNDQEFITGLDAREAATQVSELNAEEQLAEFGPGYESPHFVGHNKNLIAHSRVDDRVDPVTSGKMLFAQEHQSDWGAAIRKRGVKPLNIEQKISDVQSQIIDLLHPYVKDIVIKNATEGVGDHGFKVLWDNAHGRTVFEPNQMLDQHVARLRLAQIRETGLPYVLDQMPAEELSRYADLHKEVGELREQRDAGLPDMPFKGNLWKKLMLRNQIRHAVEGGYDSVGWTTGQTQADRYDLSKHIDQVRLYKSDSNMEQFGATPGHRVPVVQVEIRELGDFDWKNLGFHKPEQLPEVVGKELADKFLVHDVDPHQGNIPYTKEYSGLDLRVGGEGMKGFYDKELVNIANDIGKKFGAKVEKSTIPTPSQGTLEKVQPTEGWAQGMESFKTVPGETQEPIWRLPITDKMRASVAEQGQPMFMPHSHPEAIERAAIRRKSDGKIFLPANSREPHYMIPTANPEARDYLGMNGQNLYEEGFVNKKGEYQNREQAFDTMKRVGQLPAGYQPQYAKEANVTALQQSQQAMPSSDIQAAREIAEAAHEGQTRKFTEEPYITHPLAIGDLVNDRLKPAAYLHDILEDTPITADDLLGMGISPKTVKTVQDLTRQPNESYHGYINRLKQNPDARDIKVADLHSNLSTLPEDSTLRDRYIRSLNQLVPSDHQVANSLRVSGHPEKVDKIGTHRDFAEGTPVSARIDIPSYNATGDYTITVHKPNVGTVQGYDSIINLDNPTAYVQQAGAKRVKEGMAKYPMAAINGNYNPSRTVPKDIGDYVMSGFNPMKHSYFYQKGETSIPVIGGEKAVSVGNTVFWKDPVYGDPKDFLYMPQTNVGLNIGERVNALTPDEVVDAFKGAGISVTNKSVHHPEGGEPTFVGTLSRRPTPEEADAIAQALDQQAIAINGDIPMKGDTAGELYGPEADKWKPFNPDYFLDHNGHSLTHNAESVAKAPKLASGQWDSMFVEGAGEARKKDVADELGIDPKKHFFEQKPAAQQAIKDYFKETGEAQYMPDSGYIGHVTDEGDVEGSKFYNRGMGGQGHEELGYDGLQWRYNPATKKVYWWGKPEAPEKTGVEDWLTRNTPWAKPVDSHVTLDSSELGKAGMQKAMDESHLFMPSPAGDLNWKSRQYDMTPDQLEQFLIFGRSVAGHSSAQRAPMVERMMTDLLGEQGGTSPVNALQKLNQTEGGIEDLARRHGFGPYGQNVNFLKHLAENKVPDLKTVTPEELQKISGIGKATADFFKLHTDPSYSSRAKLDTHILGWLREHVDPNAPTSSPQNPATYEKYHTMFANAAHELGMTPEALDMQIWNERRVGGSAQYMPASPEEAKAATQASTEKFPEAKTLRWKLDDEGNIKLYKSKNFAKTGKMETRPTEEAYNFENQPIALSAAEGITDKGKRQDAMTTKTADGIEEMYHTIKDDPDIMQAKGWYRDLKGKLFKKLGNSMPNLTLFTRLLAATSPNTNPGVNFGFALDAWNRFKRGEYDTLIERYQDTLQKLQDGELAFKSGKKVETADDFERYIRQNDMIPYGSGFHETGEPKKLGMHSIRVLDTLSDNWGRIKGLKINQFAENLAQTDLKATIDLWAARTVHRLLNAGSTEPWRILPQNEKGIDPKDFYFAQQAFQKAADRLGVSADDLQAIIWFAEKHHYDNMGWSKYLDKGDFRPLVERMRPAGQGAFRLKEVRPPQ